MARERGGRPLRLPPNWTMLWNKLEDIEPEDVPQEDEAWLFTFVQDMTYLVTEYDDENSGKTVKHTLAIDLGWYPEGDREGRYRLVAILDRDWSRPVLEMETRSTREVVDRMELWLFETLADWKDRLRPQDQEWRLES